MEKGRYTFEDLKEIIRRLRAKDGCAWDREQTHESLRSCMKEEAYEVIEAIDKGDMDNLKEELGDILLQVIMHSQIAKEEEIFTMDDVIEGICEKLIRRHPHVFGDKKANNSKEVLDNWDTIKQKEKKENSSLDSMQRVPLALPACMKAQKIQKYAQKAGYDFLEPEEIRSKEEVGKRLFDQLNEARMLEIDGEEALEEYTKKFMANIIQKK